MKMKFRGRELGKGMKTTLTEVGGDFEHVGLLGDSVCLLEMGVGG